MKIANGSYLGRRKKLAAKRSGALEKLGDEKTWTLMLGRHRVGLRGALYMTLAELHDLAMGFSANGTHKCFDTWVCFPFHDQTCSTFHSVKN